MWRWSMWRQLLQAQAKSQITCPLELVASLELEHVELEHVASPKSAYARWSMWRHLLSSPRQVTNNISSGVSSLPATHVCF